MLNQLGMSLEELATAAGGPQAGTEPVNHPQFQVPGFSTIGNILDHGPVAPTARRRVGAARSPRAARAGSGPGVLSRLAVQTDVAEGRLVEVPCADIALERSIRAVWPSNREPSAAAKRVLRVIDERDGAS